MISKHFVIYSHGFGVQKDSRRLFTEVAASLPKFEHLMFDYNDIDDSADTLTARLSSQQAEILRANIDSVRNENPGGIIDLICHSHGCIVAGLVNYQGIRKTVLLAPPTETRADKMIEHFRKNPSSMIDLEGISKLARSDGSTTIVPSEYWKERNTLDPMSLYKDLAGTTELYIVRASGDNVIGSTDFSKIKDKIKGEVVIDTDHDFTGQARPILIESIKKILLS